MKRRWLLWGLVVCALALPFVLSFTSKSDLAVIFEGIPDESNPRFVVVTISNQMDRALFVRSITAEEKTASQWSEVKMFNTFSAYGGVLPSGQRTTFLTQLPPDGTTRRLRVTYIPAANWLQALTNRLAARWGVANPLHRARVIVAMQETR